MTALKEKKDSKIRRPKTIYLLIVFFVWSFFKNIEYLTRPSVTEKLVFQYAGYSALYYFMIFCILVLSGAAVFFLFRPSMLGRKICFLSLGSFAFFNIMCDFFLVSYPEIAWQAYVISRDARGLPIRPELQSIVTGSAGISLTIIVPLLAISFFTYLVYRNRPYFESRKIGNAK